MKHIIILILLVFGLVSFSQAQTRASLKGPAYKNAKVWKVKLPVNDIVTSDRKAGLKGPAYKHFKFWDLKTQDQQPINNQAVVFNKKRPKLMGPRYKNRKVVFSGNVNQSKTRKSEESF